MRWNFSEPTMTREIFYTSSLSKSEDDENTHHTRYGTFSLPPITPLNLEKLLVAIANWCGKTPENGKPNEAGPSSAPEKKKKKNDNNSYNKRRSQQQHIWIRSRLHLGKTKRKKSSHYSTQKL